MAEYKRNITKITITVDEHGSYTDVSILIDSKDKAQQVRAIEAIQVLNMGIEKICEDAC